VLARRPLAQEDARDQETGEREEKEQPDLERERTLP